MPKSIEDKFNPINSTKLFGYNEHFNTLVNFIKIENFQKLSC